MLDFTVQNSCVFFFLTLFLVKKKLKITEDMEYTLELDFAL